MQMIEPIIAGNPEAQSADLKAENIATLKALFPELLSERIVDGKPEPVRLLSKLIEFGSSKDSLILDFFAGSGTLGHAVAAQNATDGGNLAAIVQQHGVGQVRSL